MATTKAGFMAVAVGLSLAAGQALGEVTTTLGVEEVYDDNIYREKSDEVDAWITKVRPGAKLVMDGGGSTYSLEGQAEAGIYSQSKLGDDDYTDYLTKAGAEWEFDIRNRLGFDLIHERGHDDRGTGRMDVPDPDIAPFRKLLLVPCPPAPFVAGCGDIDDPDEWKRNGLMGEYRFGAPGARGALVLTGLYDKKDYTNNSPSTDYMDRADAELRALALLRIMPRTSLLLETRIKDIDYDEDNFAGLGNRDSDDTRYFIGVEWEATAKTTGSVRFGYQEKEPDDTTAFDDFDATAWEANVVWAPKTYSTIHFTAFRGAEESSNALSYVDTQFYTLRWIHSWSERLASSLYAQMESQDYESSTRDDDTDIWGFNTSYELFKQVKIIGDYRYEDRSSSIRGLEYERNIVTLGTEIAFE